MDASAVASGLRKPSDTGTILSGLSSPGMGPTSQSRIQGGTLIRIRRLMKDLKGSYSTGLPFGFVTNVPDVREMSFIGSEYHLDCMARIGSF